MSAGQGFQAWFRPATLDPDAQVRLFCFPHAGVGASLFSTWPRFLPAWIEVCKVQPPGREDRYHQPCYRRMEPLVDTLAGLLGPVIDRPFAFLGYSMGAVVALELARRLRKQNGVSPRHLFVAARRAPQIADPLPPMHQLAEADLLAQLHARHHGMPDVIARQPELRAIYLPLLRADLELIETYVYQPDTPLDCPISAFGGRDDLISQHDLAAWAEHTSRRFQVHVIPGQHFFLKTATAQFLRIVESELLSSMQCPR